MDRAKQNEQQESLGKGKSAANAVQNNLSTKCVILTIIWYCDFEAFQANETIHEIITKKRIFRAIYQKMHYWEQDTIPQVTFNELQFLQLLT